MKLLQINTSVNSGSHGRIAENIGLSAMSAGHISFIAATYTKRPSRSEVISISNTIDRNLHGLKTRLLDHHGFGSSRATRVFVKKINEIKPDIIHLHNIHGYYLNVGILFDFLKNIKSPVVWTLHDCWPFTGHCSHFQFAECEKWKIQCYNCPNTYGYPASWLIDNSRKNFICKKNLFTELKNLTLVTPSHWLEKQLSESFLSSYPVKLIYNGVDIDVFKPKEGTTIRSKLGIEKRGMILGVSSIWNQRKGLYDFYRLRQLLDKEIIIVLVGLTPRQVKNLPPGIIGIVRTENVSELAELYSAADMLVNPSYVDNFPNVNIEALACGTPVVTYNTGGGPEAIDQSTGIVVDYGNINELRKGIMTVFESEDTYRSSQCRERAVNLFSSKDRFGDYIKLYESVLENNNSIVN